MQTYELTLKCDPSQTFRCTKAANSVDLNIDKKLTHEFKINADLEKDYNVGLIIGNSGSGKTTLARKIFGEDFDKSILNPDISIIDQFNEKYTYEDCSNMLYAAGLSQVPCWIRPAKTLSSGQKARAEIALRLSNDDKIIVIDEFTSVVDRTIAKIMSHTVQKIARMKDRKIVLLSCHYDIIDWLQPDWIIDCNKQEYDDFRSVKKNAQNSYNSALKNAVQNHGNILANIII